MDQKQIKNISLKNKTKTNITINMLTQEMRNDKEI